MITPKYLCTCGPVEASNRLVVDTMSDYHVTASLPYADDASGHLCTAVVVVVALALAEASVTLELQQSVAYMEPFHGMSLIQIVLSSWCNHEMDSPYHDTCWMLVD